MERKLPALTMTLPEIASELDKLIQRLQIARNLLASLGPDADLPLAAAAAHAAPAPLRRRRTLSPTAAAPPAVNALDQAAEPPAKAPAPAARSHRRGSVSAPSSLTGKVPSGPVAVSASEIRRRFAAAPQPAPAPAERSQGNSLDDLLRELAERPLTSAAF